MPELSNSALPRCCAGSDTKRMGNVQRYQIVHATVHAAIAGLLYLFLKNVTDLDTSFPESANYMRGGAILILPFLFSRSTFFGDVLVEKVPLLSVGIRKLLSGKDFIEGDWPLVVMDYDLCTPKYFGFLTIRYEDEQLVVFGDDWYPNATHAVHFRSQKSRYAERRLEYWYAQGAARNQPTMFGYTNIYFFPAQGRILRHAGEFLDKEHLSSMFYAKRIRYGLFQRRLSTKEQKFAAAKSFWAEIEAKIVSRTDRKLDQDFL